MIINKKKVANNYNNEKGTNTKILTKEFERERKLKEREIRKGLCLCSRFGVVLYGWKLCWMPGLFVGFRCADLWAFRGLIPAGILARFRWGLLGGFLGAGYVEIVLICPDVSRNVTKCVKFFCVEKRPYRLLCG